MKMNLVGTVALTVILSAVGTVASGVIIKKRRDEKNLEQFVTVDESEIEEVKEN